MFCFRTIKWLNLFPSVLPTCKTSFRSVDGDGQTQFVTSDGDELSSDHSVALEAWGDQRSAALENYSSDGSRASSGLTSPACVWLPPAAAFYVTYSSSSLGSDLMWSGWSRGKWGAVVLVQTYHSLMLEKWGKAGLTERWLLRELLPLCCFWARRFFRPDRDRSRGMATGEELRSSIFWSTSLAELMSNGCLDRRGKWLFLLASEGERRLILRSRGSMTAWWGGWSWCGRASYGSWGSEVGDDLMWTFMCLRRELGWV